MLAKHHEVDVFFDHILVGWLRVTTRTSAKLMGTFHPGPHFEACRPLFEEAFHWSRQLHQAEPDVDYVAWDLWVAATGRITERVALPALPSGIDEFAIDHDLSVEVTLHA